MKDKEIEATPYNGLQNGKGLHDFRHLIWLLADPNKPAYNPMRALQLLQEAITDKWSALEAWNEERGLEPQPYAELEKLLPRPIIDNGDRSIDLQIREAVNNGLRYIAGDGPGWKSEYPHEIARRNLGFEHSRNEDTPEQEKALHKEELRVVHETCFRSAVFELGSAVDEQHRAYLQSRVDQCRENLALYSSPDVAPVVPNRMPGLEMR